MKTHLIRFHETGDASVLKYEEVELPALKDDEVLIDQKCIGVNFIDTYFRSGLYATALPSGLGFEGAGVVEAVGKNVQDFKRGDRVAYAQGPLGSYAQKRNISSQFLVKIPDGVSFEAAASLMLKGLTVYYLFHETYPLKSGETILFHAAAGGVGLIACQWARHIGATLIGTVSSDEKAEIARKNGAAFCINYKKENILERVLQITDGEKLPVVYDGIGKDTWITSIDCLRPRGLMVSFGNASGAVTGVNLGDLASRGSLYVTRPMLWAYMTSPEKLRRAAAFMFELFEKGILKVEGDQVFSLKEAGLAHKELLNRDRVGSLLLRVD